MKMLMTDGDTTLIGSLNIDNRSAYLNHEVVQTIISKPVYDESYKIFQENIEGTQPGTKTEFTKRETIQANFASLLTDLY